MVLTRMITTKNVGGLDRLLRATPALATLAAWWLGLLSGAWLGAAAVMSAMLLMTSITGACRIYYLLGLSTCPVRSRDGHGPLG